MADPTIEQNLDLNYGTLSRIIERTPPLSFAYSYQFFNFFFKGNYKEGGKELKGFFVSGDDTGEGNAGFTNPWAEDATIIKNVVQEYTLKYKHAKVSLAWNEFEYSQNKGAEQIYDYWKLKYNVAMRSFAYALFQGCINGPTSASDADSMYGISTWLPMGTNDTAGFTGYKSRYNDASATGGAAGTAFSTAGLASTSTSNARFATYFDDHNGYLDDSLLVRINTANLSLDFQAPIIPANLEVNKVQYSAYTTKNVITKLNAFYAKSDDNMGYRPESHWGTPILPGGTPLVYCPPLDTQNDSIYGTDPIYGINHNILYPVYLRDWDFKLTKNPAPNRHLVMEYFVDWGGQIWCEERRSSGWLICQRPSS